MSKIFGILNVSQVIRNPFKLPTVAPEHMVNSLTPFVVRVQQDCCEYIAKKPKAINKSFPASFIPDKAKKPTHFNIVDLTEGLRTRGPKCDYVQIADGKNLISVNMKNGAICNLVKSNRLLPASIILKRMQKVIDKFQAN